MPPEYTIPTLARLLEQQRIVAALHRCPCGALGQIYADDDVTVLCAQCWLKIYEKAIDDPA